jgi:hypothetical protein
MCLWLPLLLVALVADIAVAWGAGVLPFQSTDLERLNRMPTWLMVGPPVLTIAFVVAAFTTC